MSARAALALSALLVSAAVDAQEPPRAPRGVRPLPAAKANASAPKAPLRTAPRTAGKAPGARRATPAGPRTAPIRFEDACAPGDIVTVGVAGDVLFHAAIQRAAYATPEGFFAPLAPIREVIESVDVAIANQETVLSCCNDGLGVARANPGRQVDHHVYGSSNSVGINAAPFLAFDLKAAGFDAMTTANNHALDRGTFGVHATLDSLERRQPGTMLALTSHPELLMIPGGEPFNAFRGRVRAGWRHILGSEATDVVVVTHAGVIRALLADVLDLEWAHAQRVALPPASACRIVVHPDGIPVIESLDAG